MATGPTRAMCRVVPHLRRVALLGDRHTLGDGRLLESFVARGDEAAFEVLVKRHGPMVLGVCRRVIGDAHDAEDAFQAVFLVLARKAGSVVPRELVGNWLYGVAYRTALQARTRRNRRRARETQVTDMPQPTAPPEADLRELHQVLDGELNRLPDKYRVPIVLCDLEGRSRREVAGRLKVPEGTLSSRLATGRQLLARRLARHGLALSGGALAAALTGQAAAGVAPALVAQVVKAAALAAAGQSAAGFLSAQAVALSQGVLKTMLLHRLKLLSLAVVAFALGGLGAGVLGIAGAPGAPAARAGQPAAAPSGQAPRAAPDAPEPLDAELLLHAQVQEELRLSKNQVSRLQAVSREADVKNAPRRKEVETIQKQIGELQKQIGQIQRNMIDERRQALRQAAPQILSARAQQRLREIQRQSRGLGHLLRDAKVQRQLKLDDEQMMKIEDILKKAPRLYYEPAQALWSDGGNLAHASNTLLFWMSGPPQTTPAWLNSSSPRQVYFALGAGTEQPKVLRQLMDVLTEGQRATLLRWVGEPYQSPAWREVWDRYGKKGP